MVFVYFFKFYFDKKKSVNFIMNSKEIDKENVKEIISKF